MTLTLWRHHQQWILGLVIACLVGEVSAIPVSGHDPGLEWREPSREHASPLPPPPLAIQGEGSSATESSIRSDRTAARSHLSPEPYRPESTQTSSDAVSSSDRLSRQPHDADSANQITATAESARDDKSPVHPQNFWRGDAPRKYPAIHESPEEISRTIEEIQHDVAQLIATVAEMQVDSEGRKNFTVGGLDVFTGPQGSGIILNQGGTSLALVDYDSKRNAMSEMAIQAELGNADEAAQSFNPIIQLIQWLREVFTYPLFWVFITTLIIGYIATLIFKQRSLKRAQEIYSKHPQATALDINRSHSRSRSNHRHSTSSSPKIQPAEQAKANQDVKHEPPPSTTPLTAHPSKTKPTANQGPINPRRTGSIWLKH